MTKKVIKVFPYDPKWPQMFEVEADFIRQTLGDICVEIHHIGSTSVPGLVAKRDLDILCVVRDLKESLCLEDAGFIFRGELNIPLRYFFSKNTDRSRLNLHVVEPGHGFIHLNLGFRDYLRAHEEVRDAYGTLKKEILKDPRAHEKATLGLTKYGLKKDTFIKNILEKTGFEGLILNFCFHEREWGAYHRLRKELMEKNGRTYDPNHPTLKDPNHFYFVVYQGTEIVGCAQVEFLDGEEAALRSFAIDEAYKSRGYSAWVMQSLEKWLKTGGRSVLMLHAVPAEADFYRKLGYSEMTFKDPPFTRDAIDLGKIL